MRRLQIVLGDYPHTRPLRDGRVTSDMVDLAFVEYGPLTDAFGDMVRNQSFDVCEMPIAAFMLGRAAAEPIALLPVVVAGGFHHGRLGYWVERGHVGPAELAGKTLAIRSYSQTTGLWVRGILEDQFGVDLESLRWLTLEDAHSNAYVDPPNASRVAAGSTLVGLLRGGGAVAAVLDSGGAEGAAPVIWNVRAAEDEWYARTQAVGINHMVCVREALAEDAEVTRELCRMFAEAHTLVLGPQSDRVMRPGVPSAIREGFEEVRPALELASRYAVRQKLTLEAPEIRSLFPEYLVTAQA
jgi:4,5-dihydroxyphthalate decarboxylase